MALDKISNTNSFITPIDYNTTYRAATSANSIPKLTNVKITNIQVSKSGYVYITFTGYGNGSGFGKDPRTSLSNTTEAYYAVYVDDVSIDSGKWWTNQLSTAFVENTVQKGKGIGTLSETKTSFKVTVRAYDSYGTYSDSKTINFPSKEDLNDIIRYTDRVTNPITHETDIFNFIRKTSYGETLYTINGDNPEENDKGIKYLGKDVEVTNNDNGKPKEVTVKWVHICGSRKVTGSYTQTREPTSIPKRYANPVISQNKFNVTIRNEQEITENDKLVLFVTYGSEQVQYDLHSINESFTITPKNNCTITAKIIDNNDVYSFSDLVTYKFVLPDIDPILLKAPIIVVNKSLLSDDWKDVTIFKPKDEKTKDEDYLIYYTTDNSNPSQKSTKYNYSSSRYDLITIDKDTIIKAIAYTYQAETGKWFTSEISRTVVIVSGNKNPFYYDYEKPEIKHDKVKSYIDIINNRDYESCKSLEAVDYILNVITNPFNGINLAEQALKRRFSGNSIILYSDETYSGELNINDNGNTNRLENYKVPTFQKGHWEFNYFRNKLATPISKEELQKTYAKIPYYDSKTGETIIKDLTIEDIYKAYNISNDKEIRLATSDNRSLIYGKYIVARFIFNNDQRVKFEGVTFITNTY